MNDKNHYETITFTLVEDDDGFVKKHCFFNDGEVVAVNVSVGNDGSKLIHYTVKTRKE